MPNDVADIPTQEGGKELIAFVNGNSQTLFGLTNEVPPGDSTHKKVAEPKQAGVHPKRDERISGGVFRVDVTNPVVGVANVFHKLCDGLLGASRYCLHRGGEFETWGAASVSEGLPSTPEPRVEARDYLIVNEKVFYWRCCGANRWVPKLRRVEMN